jgi:hypothetical protein
MSLDVRSEGLFWLVVRVASALGILGLGWPLWALSPTSWRQYVEAADGPVPLLILFVVVPAVLALFGAFGFVCGVLVLTPFMSREVAEKAFTSLPYGGHLGTIERKLLSRFKSHADGNT